MSVRLTKSQPVKPAAAVLADIAAELGGTVGHVDTMPALFVGDVVVEAVEVPELLGYNVEIHTFDRTRRRAELAVSTWVGNVTGVRRLIARSVVASVVAA